MKVNKRQIIFHDLFSVANEARFDYVLLREKSTIDKILRDSSSIEDIDVYVSKQSVGTFLELLKKTNFSALFSQNTFIHLDTKLVIDVHSGNYTRFPLFDEDFFLQKSKNIEGFNYLPDNSLFLILLLHPLDLSGIRGARDYTREKHQFLKENNYRFNHPEVYTRVEEWFGPNLTNYICNLLMESPRKVSQNRIQIKLRALKHNELLRAWFKKRLIKGLKQLLFNRGKVVSIMGADGAGKTSLIESIQGLSESFPQKFKFRRVYMGFLGGYQLPFYSLKRFAKCLLKFQMNTVLNEKSGKKTIATSGTYFFLTCSFLVLEYIFRYLSIFWFSKVEKKHVILDRSIYDQHTPFSNVGALTKLARLAQKPDMFIFLEARIETLLERKQEYDSDQLKEQQKLTLKYLMKEFPEKLFVLNAEDSKTSIFSRTLVIITKLIRS